MADSDQLASLSGTLDLPIPRLSRVRESGSDDPGSEKTRRIISGHCSSLLIIKT